MFGLEGFSLIEPKFYESYKGIQANTKLEFESFRSLFEKKNGDSKPEKELYTIDAEGVAHAQIKGILRSKPSLFDEFFGVSASLTYPEIQTLADKVDADPRVKSVVFHIDSPGGYSMGCHDTFEAIALISKPTTAMVEGRCCSAAYWLASGCNRIVATSEQCEIGSIGTMVTYTVYPEDITITSSDAPKKNPDPSTEEGKAIIQASLDQVQSLFLRAVAEGRKVSVQKVTTDFGQGGTFLARQALGVGMIDELKTRAQEKRSANAPVIPVPVEPTLPQSSDPLKHSAKTENKNPKGEKMDLEKFKSEHPAVFAEAIELGAKAERDRVAELRSFADADKDNAKVQELVAEAISQGLKLSEIQGKMLIAIRDGKALNAPPVATQTSDPASNQNKDAETLAKQDEEAFNKMFGGKRNG